MDILIKGMKMPKACFKGAFDHCPFYATCEALKNFCNEHSNEDIINKIYQCRMDDCPLIAVPKHGELIDRSLLKGTSYEIMRFPDDEVLRMFIEAIENAPTVLEAST